jgi:hypothetical protein
MPPSLILPSLSSSQPDAERAAAVELLPEIERETAERQKATQAKPGEQAHRRVSQKVDSPTERNEGKATAKAAAKTGPTGSMLRRRRS